MRKSKKKNLLLKVDAKDVAVAARAKPEATAEASAEVAANAEAVVAKNAEPEAVQEKSAEEAVLTRDLLRPAEPALNALVLKLPRLLNLATAEKLITASVDAEAVPANAVKYF